MVTNLSFDFSRYEYVLDPVKYTLTEDNRAERAGATKNAIDCLMDTSQIHRKLKTEIIKNLYDFAVAYTADQEQKSGRVASFFQKITGFGELSTLQALCSGLFRSYEESVRNPLPEPPIEELVAERIEEIKKSKRELSELLKLHDLLQRGLKDRKKDWYKTALSYLEEELCALIVKNHEVAIPQELFPSLVKAAQTIDFIENLLILTRIISPQAHRNVLQAVTFARGEFPKEFHLELDKVLQEKKPEQSSIAAPKITKCDEVSTLKRDYEALLTRRLTLLPGEYRKILDGLQDRAFVLFAKKSTDPETLAVFADLIEVDSACKHILKALCPSDTHSFAEVLKKDTHKIRSRLLQFAAIKDKAGLTLIPSLKLAYFIEMKAARMQRNYYKKQATGHTTELEQYDIPYSLMYNKEGKEFYVLLKRKVFVLNETCTYKKVTAAIRLPSIQKGQSSQVEIVAQAVTKDGLSKKSHDVTRREQLRWEQIKGYTGIWKPYFHAQYTSEKNAEKVSKFCTFSELADGSLGGKKAQFTHPELIKITKLLVTGLCHMHEQKIIHADVKEANALYKRMADGTINAGWIDFGLSILEDTPDQNNVMDNGFYGAYEYTAPELFGVEKFRGDFRKLDTFALGYLLYTLHFKEKPKWGEIIKKLFIKKEKKVPNYCKQVVFDLIREYVEKPLDQLLKKPKKTREEHFSVLIYKLLRFDPTSRVSLVEASKFLTQLEI